MSAWMWQDWALLGGIVFVCWCWSWFQIAIWDEQYAEKMAAQGQESWEYTRAHVGTNYARSSIDEKEAEGWEICSEVDPRYGSVWMRRPAC